jgi:hypothetical protein
MAAIAASPTVHQNEFWTLSQFPNKLESIKTRIDDASLIFRESEDRIEGAKAFSAVILADCVELNANIFHQLQKIEMFCSSSSPQSQNASIEILALQFIVQDALVKLEILTNLQASTQRVIQTF